MVSPQLANAFLGALTQQLSPQKPTGAQSSDGSAADADSNGIPAAAQLDSSGLDTTTVRLAALADASSTFVSEHELLHKARDRLRDLREALLQEAEAKWKGEHEAALERVRADTEAQVKLETAKQQQ